MTYMRAAELLSEVTVLDDPEMAEAHRVAISALRQQEQERKAATGEGLRCKYIVRKADTGEGVDGCFVLRPDRDRAAVAALRAYAAATDNDVLATDILNWVGQESNAPLTLDDLREAAQTGDPVWLVGMEDGDGWVFIHHVDSCSVRYARIGTSEEWCFRTKSYGVRVWAYRQKPEEDDHDERKEN